MHVYGITIVVETSLPLAQINVTSVRRPDSSGHCLRIKSGQARSLRSYFTTLSAALAEQMRQ